MPLQAAQWRGKSLKTGYLTPGSIIDTNGRRKDESDHSRVPLKSHRFTGSPLCPQCIEIAWRPLQMHFRSQCGIYWVVAHVTWRDPVTDRSSRLRLMSPRKVFTLARSDYFNSAKNFRKRIALTGSDKSSRLSFTKFFSRNFPACKTFESLRSKLPLSKENFPVGHDPKQTVVITIVIFIKSFFLF